jgi:hypothetical protein
VVPDIYNVITAPHIQPSIFNWICLRCHWRYADIWMRVILQSWCQIQRTFSGLRYVNCGPGHMQCNYSYVYSDFNIQVNQSALLLEISRYFDARYNVNLVAYIAHTPQFTLCELWSWHIQCKYSSAYSGFNIHLNLPALLLEICRYLYACYTANFVPNTEPILRFALCELWSRTYTMHLQLRTFRLQYSSERICAAIGNISTIQCSLYCKLGAKYSA